MLYCLKSARGRSLGLNKPAKLTERLLDGSGQSSRLSADELLSILKERRI